MKTFSGLLALTAVGLLGSQVWAQHSGHQAGSSPGAAEAAACAQAQLTVTPLLDRMNATLEHGRQLNTAAEMRAAVHALQGDLRDLRRQLEPCAALQTMADPHGGHAMPHAEPVKPSPKPPPPDR
ncbi:MAG: hypothetical protein ACT4QD_21500 [Acidobacteriota bacterium]